MPTHLFDQGPGYENAGYELKSAPVSDLLTAAAEKLGTPADLVSRSASARAEANGTSVDDVLAAWAGGAAAAAPDKPEPESEATSSSEPEPGPAAKQEPSRPEPELEEISPVIGVPEPVAVEAVEDEPVLEPVDLAERLRTAGRVGTWTGAILGLFAFVMAISLWSETASVAGDETLSPVLVADSSSLLIGAALVSIVFGAVVASLSRAAAGWNNPAMNLASSKASTAWTGGIIGLILGLGAGAALSGGFGTPIEGSEGMVQLPVLATLAVMLIGGAVLGGLTTLATQLFGVPVSLADDDSEQVGAMKARLGNAIGIPMAGLILLLVLVLPFAWALIESNHLTSGGAAVIAIIASSGILAFASLAGTKPNMRITRGELMIAVAGIGIVIVIVFAVLANLGGGEHSEEEAAPDAAAVVQLV